MAPPTPFSSRAARLVTSLVALVLATLAPALPGAAQETPSAAPQADLPRRVVVRFLTEGDFPPFNFYDEEGVLTGLNVDLARAICLEMSAACDIKVRPWNELVVVMMP